VWWLERRTSTEASCWNDGVRWTKRGCSVRPLWDRASEGSAMMSANGRDSREDVDGWPDPHHSADLQPIRLRRVPVVLVRS